MDVLRFLSGVLGNAVDRSAVFLGAYASQSVSVCKLSIQSLSLKLGKLHNYSRTTLKRIVRSQSTEQFSGVPCMITLLSCSLYTWCGPPFVSPDNLLLLIRNSMGVVIELTKTQKLFCCIMIDISSTIMYASPLLVMKLVIKTKSVEFMPFLLSLSCFLFGIFWLAYGLLSQDPFLIVPNGLGTALGIVQLILYAMYRKNCSHTKHETKDEIAAMDL
ncbi:hypothetical protein NL676_026331 [Syzygium grande]|nr:hypothetical protein NL676_026331 [Syzygium grande]